ncbi:MAG: ATP-binding protein [Hydrocarboniphaga sp.]|uniref:ABC transporter ATP-binding protein n=1 Tax=Hydrocarboniphaga sp. TaxID=2033016 RepID=UPI002606E9A6|nr:ABC transporter ATP-binding protein [Hydrocarboniphaga sp.]MDB5972040.1 ATP-binding protein [Hydrocarboniphaga sp.]
MISVQHLRKVYPGRNGGHVALADVSLDVPRGFKLGLLGHNGAGKSTLIRLIGKVELPTSGVVEHGMSVSWPLGFAGSFQGSLSGIDNMKFIARIYRTDYPRLRRFVEDFSELGRFLYEPVKTYSTGMRARLAFALSIAVEFDCYLIDEIVMVGDSRFHARCNEHLFDRRADRALVLASHDTSFIGRVCDGALLLSGGYARYYDDVQQAILDYQAL